MKWAWTVAKLVAIATLVGILAIAPVGAFEVLPNKNLTGGSVRTKKPDEACGHAKESRGQMTQARQDEVLTRYKLPPGKHPDYEIDHLIPLCLGGSDDLPNLWPQPKRRTKEIWNADEKQRLEEQGVYTGRFCDRLDGRISERLRGATSAATAATKPKLSDQRQRQPWKAPLSCAR
jgi:hypothetical protein